MHSTDDLVRVIFDCYFERSFKPSDGRCTVLAAFYLVKHPPSSQVKVISLGTGTKCLPTSHFPQDGSGLHDYHAEIIARRGFVRCVMEEILRIQTKASFSSQWLVHQAEGYTFRVDVKVGLYVSTLPCGDASTRFLAALQDPEMAALKDSDIRLKDHVSFTGSSRGRDGYSLLGVLRTKPGRADSPPTSCMSCSDKIASYSILGVQGALASHLLGAPIYIDNIIIGGVSAALQLSVIEDCKRAFVDQLPPKYHLHAPSIAFTSLKYAHEQNVLGSASSAPESLSWIADTSFPFGEVLVNGYRRGVPLKHRHREKMLPRTCRLALFKLYCTVRVAQLETFTPPESIAAAKHIPCPYLTAKDALLGSRGPFSGWIRGAVPL
ncbi:hypothetical protein FISHEDRAFT_48493 [Fistulina hepatica ATCC 64428]|uniref:A to I editase domain-containing protein n=1 Tax=Fistulina hepatica ATCC 64428 TaxID=1128425 RepID=A0A0D7A7N9_9AGAR|nr:hypothetical protein FISHEDRAFT_48493 [Fistulina hepatica ATCC 64428]